MSDFDYRVEYAPSSRSTCKRCQQKIPQDSMRFGKLIQSSHFDGKFPLWFHMKCYWNDGIKASSVPHNITAVEGVDLLRPDDYDKLDFKIQLLTGKVKDLNTNRIIPAPVKRKTEAICLERLKRSKTKCTFCSENIDNVELSSLVDLHNGIKVKIGKSKNGHVDCYIRNISDTSNISFDQLFTSVSDELNSVLIKSIKRQIYGLCGGDNKENKNNILNNSDHKQVENNNNDNNIEHQNKIHFKIYDDLSHLSKTEMITVLSHNKISGNSIEKFKESRLRHTIADCIMFGICQRCPQCQKGIVLLDYNLTKYSCINGYLSEFTKCNYSTTEPIYDEFNYNIDIKLHCEYVNSPQFKKDWDNTIINKRLFRVSVKRYGYLIEDEDVVKKNKVHELFIVKNIADCTRQYIDNLLVRSDDIQYITNVLLIKHYEIIRKCIENNIGIISIVNNINITNTIEDLIEREILNNKENESQINSHIHISSGLRIEQVFINFIKTYSQQQLGENILPEKIDILKIKGKYHYSTLNRTDVTGNINSYYIMGILLLSSPINETSFTPPFFLCRKWGRLHTSNIGDFIVDAFDDINDVLSKFHLLYKEKTGISYNDSTSTRRVPGKFYELQVASFEKGEDVLKNNTSHSREELLKRPTRTPPDIVNFISIVCDVNLLKKTMVRLNLNCRYLLSEGILKQGLSILQCISQSILNNEINDALILDKSNAFFNLIPMKFPRLIRSNMDIEFLKNIVLELLDVSYTVSELFNEENNNHVEETDDILFNRYNRLNCYIQLVDTNSDVYMKISKYFYEIGPTHEKDCENMKINHIYQIANIKQSNGINNNRLLLWHGSRVTNIASILKNGLQIAPPEAPSTGYMFGKGIYFADVSSKSIQYSLPDPISGKRWLFLCAVDLGDCMIERTRASYNNINMSSVKGVGQYHHKTTTEFTEGISVPSGDLYKDMEIKTDLVYNEYIVYNTSLVQIMYIVELAS